MDEEKYKSKHHKKIYPPMDLSTIAPIPASEEVATPLEPKALGEQMDRAIKRKQKDSEPPASTAPELTAEELIKYKNKVYQATKRTEPLPAPEPIQLTKEQLKDKSTAVENFIKRIGNNIPL